MTYTLDIDSAARAKVRALTPAATTALAEAFEVLSLVPERGEPLNASNPDGGLCQLTLWRRKRVRTPGLPDSR